MSGRVESCVLDEGDSAGGPQESFENHFRDVLKYDAYITYCMHAHSFKAALGAVHISRLKTRGKR